MNKQNSDKKYISLTEMLDLFVENKTNAETISDVWLKIVGEKLAGRCTLNDIKNGVLIIEVDHPAVAQDLMLKKGMIIKRTNEKYPELNIKKIRTVVKNHYIHNKPAKPVIKFKPEKININKNLPPTLKSIFKRIKSDIENKA